MRWAWRHASGRGISIDGLKKPSVRLDLGQGDLVKGAKRRGRRSDAYEKKRDHQSYMPSRDRNIRDSLRGKRRSNHRSLNSWIISWTI